MKGLQTQHRRLLFGAAAGLVVVLAWASTRSSDERSKLLDALARGAVTSRDRELLHLSHTCDLVVDGATLLVLDVREIVPRMAAPRGYNRIVILDAKLNVVQAIPYNEERPLSCYGNRLLVHGALSVESDNQRTLGNLLRFTRGGRSVHAETIEWNQLPPP
jgi:hypothetical protein